LEVLGSASLRLVDPICTTGRGNHLNDLVADWSGRRAECVEFNFSTTAAVFNYEWRNSAAFEKPIREGVDKRDGGVAQRVQHERFRAEEPLKGRYIYIVRSKEEKHT
jgi:hypothetical protein